MIGRKDRARHATTAVATLVLGSLAAACTGADVRKPAMTTGVDPSLTCPGDIATAAQFVDSIGVATHLSYRRTPYRRSSLVQELLVDLGVRHIRDGWPADDQRLARRALALAEQGIRITFVHDPREGGTPEEQHRWVRDNLLQAVEAAESLNEPDLQDGDWAAESIEWTRRLSAAYRGDERTEDVPLLAPSLSQVNDGDAHEALAPLQGVVDYGNTHNYPGKDIVMNDEILDTVLRHQHRIVGDGPVIATETGYSDGPEDAPYEVVSQEQIAVLLPGLFLENFRRGISRTFAYELLDEAEGRGFEDNFGLVEHDGTPKPSYESLRELIAVLSGPDTACGQPELRWSIEGDDGALRSLVLRGGEDQYFIALWRQVRPSSDDPAADERSVKVRITNPVDTVVQHRPSEGDESTDESQGGQVELMVSPSVTLLEVNDVEPVPSPSATGTARP